MPDSHTEVYVHLVWTTRQRIPWLAGEIRDLAYGCIRTECDTMRLDVIALNGVEDHVHLLVRVTATISIAALVKQIKGSSSHLIRRSTHLEQFSWQEGYSAFSVSRWDISKIKEYIASQEEHHRAGTFKSALEPPTGIGD
jgi:REP element-mobilizing transposase RayT